MGQVKDEKDSVKLFWTGGWDSTFQLLKLLIIHKSVVIPYYLIDENRRSTGVELKTMKRIKEAIFEKYPETKTLLRNTQFFSVSDIPDDEAIYKAYQNILKQRHIGEQYEWLARFCKQHSFTNMQLCVHREGNHPYDARILKKIDDKYGYMVNTDCKGTDDYMLSEFYSFPLFDITKAEMVSIMEQQDWKDIMTMTWFCHHPKRGDKPCGLCNPCKFAIKSGLTWRIPTHIRIKGKGIRFLRDLAKKYRDRLRPIIRKKQ